ncbi:MAG: carboxyltransferase domain-containing protein [Candidatus Nanopelagicales bacterium]
MPRFRPGPWRSPRNTAPPNPRRSPGGWHILGICDLELFNPEQSQPALLIPGFTVRFEAR